MILRTGPYFDDVEVDEEIITDRPHTVSRILARPLPARDT